jgi:hypothetical protein
MVVWTFNLSLEPSDWDTMRFDTTNSIEVPAWFWADDEEPILVSVRRKSSRALPSESDPIKVSLKIDINEFVDGQQWRGLLKLSLENGGDVHPVAEGLAWNLHEMASVEGFYGDGYFPALANWAWLNVNGEPVGLYTNVEQRDTQFLRNRDLRSDAWFYEIDDINGWELEVGDPHSPTFEALCYAPFSATGESCPTPSDADLLTELDSLIDMRAMLTQGAIDAFTDNPDALFSHGKNYFYADWADFLTRKRRYYPWDLDAVFRKATAGIYGRVAKRGQVSQSSFQEVILNHPVFRARYNIILLNLIDPEQGPLSEAKLHAFLDDLEAVLGVAITEDPYISESPDETFANLKSWISLRVSSVAAQVAANGPPPPRD